MMVNRHKLIAFEKRKALIQSDELWVDSVVHVPGVENNHDIYHLILSSRTSGYI